MSWIQLHNDTWHLRNQILPAWTAVGDLLWFDWAGWYWGNWRSLRTSTSQPINWYVAVLDSWVNSGTICLSNGITTWKWWNAVGDVVYEDTTNPAKVTTAPWGKRIGMIKWGHKWKSLQYEWDSFFIDCFDNNVWDANNWLSIKWWVTVLWQDVWEAWDPAKLLNDREIPMVWKRLDLIWQFWDRTIFDWVNWHLYVGWEALTINSWDGAGQLMWTFSLFNRQAKWNSNQWLRITEYVWWDWNPFIWSDEVVDFAYPQDTTWNIQRFEAFRWLRYKRDWSGNITSSQNFLNSDNGLYTFWANTWPFILSPNYLPPISSSATVEPLAIDTANGQIVRYDNKSIPVWSLISDFNRNLNTGSWSFTNEYWDENILNHITIIWLTPAPVWKKRVFSWNANFAMNGNISTARNYIWVQFFVSKNWGIWIQSNTWQRATSSSATDWSTNVIHNLDCWISFDIDVANWDVIWTIVRVKYFIPTVTSFWAGFYQTWVNWFISLKNI